MNITFDTLELTKRLIEAGFSKQQSEAVITVMRDAQAELATKADIKELALSTKADIDNLRINVGWQIKGLYAMNAGTIAGIIWLANIVLDALKHLPK